MIQDFYPTPETLMSKMLDGISLGQIKTVLEPSAGKADLCDYVKKRTKYHSYHESTVKIDAIEINEDLQHIIKGKGYQLIHDDFLTFRTYKHYDLIIANFPFSRGDEHLQRAIDLIERNGGRLVCLVNAETIRNDYSNSRKIIVKKLEMMNADIEFLTGEFVTAERKTNVEVALIKVTAEKPQGVSVILDAMKTAQVQEIQTEPTAAIVSSNFLTQIIANFNVECELGMRLIDEYFTLAPLIKNGIVKPGETDYTKPIIEIIIDGASSYNGKTSYVNAYLEHVRHKYWAVLIRDTRFSGKYTSNILKELDEKLKDLKQYDFTLFNISELEKDLSKKISVGIEKSILDMFDDFSRKFSYWDECSANVHYYNGWKTNKAHKINKKIILPINGYSSYSSKTKLDDYYIGERLNDMVKVFNYLSDEQVNVRQLVGNSLESANQNQKFSNIDLRYFDISFYKKGTAHIRFKDEKLLDKLNIYGSQRKGWLPPRYGKAKYDDLDQESKQVIDEFQGKDKYEEIVKESEYYLVEPKNLMISTSLAA